MKTSASVMGWTCLISTLALTDARGTDLEHIDRLAYSIKRQTALICRELRLGFRQTPHYHHLYSDVYKMYRLADHIHDVAHHAPNLPHMRSDARELDELMHHVQELLGASVADARYDFHTGVGLGVSGYHGRRMRSLIDGLEDSVHHLLDDLNVAGRRTRPLPIPPPAPPTPPEPILRVPTHYRSVPSRGLTIPISRKGRFLFSLTIR